MHAPARPHARMQANLRMLVYSGDVDGIVPVVGTRRWVASLRLKERAGWRPWMVNGQVRGLGGRAGGLSCCDYLYAWPPLEVQPMQPR